MLIPLRILLLLLRSARNIFFSFLFNPLSIHLYSHLFYVRSSTLLIDYQRDNILSFRHDERHMGKEQLQVIS